MKFKQQSQNQNLKMGKLTHQDLGQMQMYVNYYTREMMNEGDT